MSFSCPFYHLPPFLAVAIYHCARDIPTHVHEHPRQYEVDSTYYDKLTSTIDSHDSPFHFSSSFSNKKKRLSVPCKYASLGVFAHNGSRVANSTFYKQLFSYFTRLAFHFCGLHLHRASASCDAINCTLSHKKMVVPNHVNEVHGRTNCVPYGATAYANTDWTKSKM